MVIFGTIGFFVRYIDLASSEIALLRGIIGSLFLFITLLSVKQRLSWEKMKENALFLLLSGIALGGNWVFLFQAYKYTTISNATLSYYFAPVFLMILSPVLLKERLSFKKIACIGVAMFGMFLIVGSSGGSAAGYHHLYGILYGLTAAGFYASLMLLNKFMKNLSGLETTLIQLATASLLLMPYVFLTEGFTLFSITKQSLLFILILGVVHTGVGFFLFFSGMKLLKGQSIASLSYIDPITALIISTVILRENMTVIQFVGGVLLLGSIFVSEKFACQPKRENEVLKSQG